MLSDAFLYQRCIKLAQEIYKDKHRPNGERWIEHPKRMVDRALLLDWPDYVIGAIWLHDAFQVDPISFSDILDQIKEFNPRVAFFVDKCAFKQWEHWSDFVNRCSASPETKGIKWLEFLDELSDNPDVETRNRLLEALPKLIPDYFKTTPYTTPSE